MEEVGDFDKAGGEVFGVKEEEEGVKEIDVFQFCLGFWILFICCTGDAPIDSACMGVSEQLRKSVTFNLHIFQSIL